MSGLGQFIEQQLRNEFFSGGLALALIMGALAALRHVPGKALRLLKRRLITTVDISDHDQSFYWVQGWLGRHEYTRGARLLTLTTRVRPFSSSGHGPAPSEKATSDRKRVLTEMIFSPAPGVHLFRHRGHFVLLTKTRTESESISDLAYHESIILQAFSRKVIQELVHDARESFFPPDDNRIAIFRAGNYSWRLAQRRLARTIDSVVLEPGIAEELLADIRWFLDAESWYGTHGIPYQRGYMLDGPPGNGKTSIVVALAGVLDRDIYIMSLAGLNDAQINNLMSELPEQSILLIEDIDRAFVGRERTKDAGESLSFSGVLNAIDGVSAPLGRILFTTTNHVENIDPALLRPGRIDKRITLTNATPDTARRLFLRFFPDKKGLAEELALAIRSAVRPHSMAEIQELLISHLNNPQDAIGKVR